MSEITIEDFMKLDLRVARVEKAESVEEADKLLKLISSISEKLATTELKGCYYLWEHPWPLDILKNAIRDTGFSTDLPPVMDIYTELLRAHLVQMEEEG